MRRRPQRSRNSGAPNEKQSWCYGCCAARPWDAVARDSQMPAHALEEWPRVFLDGGTKGLKKRVDPEERELKRVQAKLG